MKNRLLLFFSLLLFWTNVFSQFSGVKNYQNSGTVFSIKLAIATQDTGLIIGGISRDSILHYPASCIKLDKNGAIPWQFHHIIGSLTWQSGIELADGSFILGQARPLIVRHSANGNFLWKKILNFHQSDLLVSMCPAYNNSFMLIGSSSQQSPWYSGFWTAQFDTAGNVLHAIEYQITTPNLLVLPEAIAGDSFGAMSFAMLYDTLTNTQYPAFLRFDSVGNLLSNKTYFFADSIMQDFPQKIVSDHRGNYYFSGFDHDFRTIFFGKIDSSADFVWLKKIEYTGVRPGDLLFTNDRKIVLMNNYYNNPNVGSNILIFDSTGTLLENHFYSNYLCNTLNELKDGRLVLCGVDFTTVDNVVIFLDSLLHLPCRDSSLIYNATDMPGVNPVSFSFTTSNNLTFGQLTYANYSGVFQETVLCDSATVTSVLNFFEDDYSVKVTSAEPRQLIVNCATDEKVDIKLFTLTGALIYSQKSIRLTQGENYISLEKAPQVNGLSLIRVTGDKFSKTVMIPIR